MEIVLFQKPPILTTLYFLSMLCLESPVPVATERWNIVTDILTVYFHFVFCFIHLCLCLRKYDALKYRTYIYCGHCISNTDNINKTIYFDIYRVSHSLPNPAFL
jgi:hypothetical protein